MPDLRPQSGWTMETLLAFINERDRRYAVERETALEAVKLAKQVADSARGTVGVVGAVAVVGGVFSILAAGMSIVALGITIARNITP